MESRKNSSIEFSNQFEKRKVDHIKFALDRKTQALVESGFSDIGLRHEALPEINFSQVSLSTTLLNQKVPSPHFVSSMTAGHEKSEMINQALAEACSIKGWMFAVGSQRKELVDPKASLEWKKIKSMYSNTMFLSNIGIEEVVQSPVKQILSLVDNLEAAGLIIHLNSLQEVFQLKKDVFFKDSLAHISKLVKASPVPVIVKEVGFGFNEKTAQKLFAAGVSAIDVAGSGGTHWGMIEALRNKDSISGNTADAFKDWGYTTAQSLMNLKSLKTKTKSVWASGGIRSGVDSAKAIALGAKAVGTAQPLLKAILTKDKRDPAERALEVMEAFDFELRTAMFCTGLKDIKDFTKQEVWYEKSK